MTEVRKYRYRFSPHAQYQARKKGFHPLAILAAACDPEVTYPSRNHPGQHRHIRDGLCVVVEHPAEGEAQGRIITMYVHCEETALRPDQIAAGAIR